MLKRCESLQRFVSSKNCIKAETEAEEESPLDTVQVTRSDGSTRGVTTWIFLDLFGRATVLGGSSHGELKWVITPFINGISRVNPHQSLGWTNPLTSRGMSHQVPFRFPAFSKVEKLFESLFWRWFDHLFWGCYRLLGDTVTGKASPKPPL